MGVFNKERSKILGFEGQIKSFHGPHLARRPYVVHACVKGIKFLVKFSVLGDGINRVLEN